jgi:hypothetical protein
VAMMPTYGYLSNVSAAYTVRDREHGDRSSDARDRCTVLLDEIMLAFPQAPRPQLSSSWATLKVAQNITGVFFT